MPFPLRAVPQQQPPAPPQPAINKQANVELAEQLHNELHEHELPGGRHVVIAPIQGITRYVQELRSAHGIYRQWADDPDQAHAVIDTMMGNPTVWSSVRYIGLSAVGNRWSVVADNPSMAPVAKVVEAAIKHCVDFLHGRRVLTKAVISGLALAHVTWQRVVCCLGDDPYPREWVVPVKLHEVDKRRLRLYRPYKRRDLAYWGIWDPGVDQFVALEDRASRPEVPPGFARQDFLWYYGDFSERSAAFGEGIGDQLFEIVGILQRVIGYRARLAERWAEPTFIYKLDTGVGVITEATMGDAFKSPYARADEFQTTMAKWTARHTLALPKTDELEIAEHGAGTAASHEDFFRYLEEQIKSCLLMGGLIDTPAQRGGGLGSGTGNSGEERAEAIEVNIQYHRQRLEETCTIGLVDEFCKRNATTLMAAGHMPPQVGDLSMNFTSHKAQDPEMLKARLEIAEKWMPQGVPQSWLQDELDVPAAQPGEAMAVPKPEPAPMPGMGGGNPFGQFARGYVPRGVVANAREAEKLLTELEDRMIPSSLPAPPFDRAQYAAGFDEADHPRDGDGKFTTDENESGPSIEGSEQYDDPGADFTHPDEPGDLAGLNSLIRESSAEAIRQGWGADATDYAISPEDYANLPPLIVDEIGRVIDGHHRTAGILQWAIDNDRNLDEVFVDVKEVTKSVGDAFVDRGFPMTNEEVDSILSGDKPVQYADDQARDPDGRWSSGVGGKAVSVAKAVWKTVNAAPTLTAAIVKQTGVSPRVAKVAYAISLIGDWSTPFVPTGSLTVALLATVGTGGRAPKRAVEAARKRWKERKGASQFADEPGGKWITIGAQKFEGKNEGGVPVYVVNGKIAKGPAGMVGNSPGSPRGGKTKKPDDRPGSVGHNGGVTKPTEQEGKMKEPKAAPGAKVLDDFTDGDLIAEAKRYKEKILDGGEGFNPFEEERERRSREAIARSGDTGFERRAELKTAAAKRLDVIAEREQEKADGNQKGALFQRQIDALFELSLVADEHDLDLTIGMDTPLVASVSKVSEAIGSSRAKDLAERITGAK